MSISNKYNIPEDTFKKMLKDGILSSKWPTYDEVYDMFKSIQANNPTKSKSTIYYEIAEAKKMNEFTVKQIVTRMDKI